MPWGFVPTNQTVNNRAVPIIDDSTDPRVDDTADPTINDSTNQSFDDSADFSFNSVWEPRLVLDFAPDMETDLMSSFESNKVLDLIPFPADLADQRQGGSDVRPSGTSSRPAAGSP